MKRYCTTGFGAVVCAMALLSMPAAAQDGYIKAYGAPGDAGVWVNGKYVGPSHRFTLSEKYAAPAGEVEVTFREPRYEDYTTKVNVQARKTTKIKYTLKKREEPTGPFGRLRLGGGEAESFISVAAGDTGPIYLNDRFVGYVDELNNAGGGLLINPGTYDLLVDSQRFGQIHQKVTIEANKVTVVPLEQKESQTADRSSR
ncbi:MAG TPA: PEGA domain-containing protein [Bryobacteraceae bacterium]|nr:PEGA domain-containing protein [Bryobacteraceae bacterium]